MRPGWPLLAAGLFVLAWSPTASAGLNVPQQIVFVDEDVVVEAQSDPGEAEIAILDRQGWEKPRLLPVHFSDGKATIRPIREGIHRVRIGADEVRFLAIDPPPPIDAAALRKALPRSAGRVLAGEPYTIVALGDSVTATGPYAKIFARFLERATGNQSIRVEVRGHPGKSIDATVRSWESDVVAVRPDLALIMYGLNDQGAASPLAAYVEQLGDLVRRLHSDVDADALLLEPTPHICILPGDANAAPLEESQIFRTITFAAAVRQTGLALDVPVARTFDALWAGGADSLMATAKKLRVFYPVSYQEPFTTMLERDEVGDTIHPNALGHLALARAAFEALGGKQRPDPLAIAGTTQWREEALVTGLTVRNSSGIRQAGRLMVYPQQGGGLAATFPYTLKPGASARFQFTWPSITKPEDLLHETWSPVFHQPGPFLQILIQSENASAATAVAVPFHPDVRWLPGRQIAAGPEVLTRLQVDGEVRSFPVSLPAASDVGRMVLRTEVEKDGRRVPAAAELVFVRFGAAVRGERTVDGSLEEWGDARWVPVGETCQARSNLGVRDFRASPEECRLQWTFAAGESGITLAVRADGDISQDSFALFFDPRDPGQLGTVGPYFWVDGKINADGAIGLTAGETSPPGGEPRGRWRQSGKKTDGEMFVPYSLFRQTAWPTSGDLGLSIIWTHPHADKNITRLMWSENGHPWTPRWFGVVRLEPQGVLPFLLRIP